MNKIDLKLNFQYSNNQKKEILNYLKNADFEIINGCITEYIEIIINNIKYTGFKKCLNNKKHFDICLYKYEDIKKVVEKIETEIDKRKGIKTSIKKHWRTEVSEIAEKKRISFDKAKIIWKKNK